LRCIIRIKYGGDNLNRMQQIKSMIVDEIFDDGQACDATALENFKRVANDICKFLRGPKA